MKKIFLFLFIAFSVVGYSQTQGVPSNLTFEQILKNSLKQQSNGLPVLRLVPVTTSGSNYNASKLSQEQIRLSLFRRMPDGSYALAVDNSLLTGGGGGGATNLSITTGANTIGLNSSTGIGATIPAATITTAGVMTATDKVNFNQIQSLTGITAGTSHLGTFTGSTFTDNSTIKAVLQEAETAIETKQKGIQVQDETIPLGTTGTVDQLNFTGSGVTATRSGNAVNVVISGASLTTDNITLKTTGSVISADTSRLDKRITSKHYVDSLVSTSVKPLITLSGMPANSTNLSVFSGNIISDNMTIKTGLQELETSTESKVQSVIPTIDGLSNTQFSVSNSSTAGVKTTTIDIKPMGGANGTLSGQTGLVPTPNATDNVKFLRGDGTWQTVTSSQYNTSLAIVGGNIQLTDGAGTLQLPVINIAPVQSVVGTGNITVTNAAGVYTVNYVDGDTSSTNEIQTISATAASANSTTVSLTKSGGSFTLSTTAPLSLTGSANAPVVGFQTLVAYDNDIAAAVAGIAVGGWYKASVANTMGMKAGTVVTRNQ